MRTTRGLVVRLGDGHDAMLEFFRAAERGALDGALAEQGEPALDLVRRRGVCWGEVEMEPLALRVPGLGPTMLVWGVVVADKVDGEVGGRHSVDQPREGRWNVGVREGATDRWELCAEATAYHPTSAVALRGFGIRSPSASGMSRTFSPSAASPCPTWQSDSGVAI